MPSNEDLLKAAVSWLNSSNGSDIPSNSKLASTISKNTKATSNAKNNSSSIGIPYSLFCAALTQIESTTKRLEIQSILTKLFRTALLTHPTNLIHLVYLSCNAVAPKYDCVELGIGDALLMKAIVQSCGISNSVVKARCEEHGDLGTVAEMNRGKQKTLSGMFGGTRKLKPLVALEVLDVFRHIATTSGNQSQKFKIDKIKSLLVRATNPKHHPTPRFGIVFAVDVAARKIARTKWGVWVFERCHKTKKISYFIVWTNVAVLILVPPPPAILWYICTYK